MHTVRVAFLASMLLPLSSSAQAIKPRISVLLDSSASMLLTPEVVTFPETCVANGFNACVASGANPTAAQESCNACVADTVRFRPTCATNWSASCRTDYQNCYQQLTGQTGCAQTLNLTDGVPTRGDGSLETPGCDLNGDGLPNDSRMYQAKTALSNVLATFGELEFSLWRYAQVEGGQTCVTNATCPLTPGGLAPLTCNAINGTNFCTNNAAQLDAIPTTVGQCDPYTWNGAAAAFDCTACDFTNSYDRALCEARALNRVRTGALSPLNNTSAVNCALPTTDHRFIKPAGALINGAACDPTGGQRLVDFPATGFDDNHDQLVRWIDHVQPNFATDVELKPTGGTPIAAALRDMRNSVLASMIADTRTPCRRYRVIVLTDGGESCETVAAARAAALGFQNLSFVNAAGVVVSGYNVPVHVIGFAICPPGQPNCQTAQDLNSIASAGGTSSAVLVSNQLELQAALSQLASASVSSERCNGLDDNCNGQIDEDFPGVGSACAVGVGVCQRQGQLACSTNLLACNATPGTPVAELCNGEDDNCNGVVDEGVSCQGCIPSCTNAAHCDVCNNLDEDCDGQIDEDAASSACGPATGECNPGTTTCVAGVTGCSGAQGPVAESCDGLDNDCDGVTDGITAPCYPPATSGCSVATGVCSGICRLGTATCTAGAQGTCSAAVTPRVEVPCNGLDDDCDGAVDEGSASEQCNGQDDDCDGQVDEGVDATDPDVGAACGTPPFVGQCRQGSIQCVAGVEQCVGEVNPATETCDGQDNDCDGTADDGVPGFGGVCGASVGQCTTGTLQCVSGAPRCVGSVGPFLEVCDLQDNDCNGQTDEADPALGGVCNTLPNGMGVATEDGECRFGVVTCTPTGLACVGAIGPAAELCNGRDDDCDGATDEAFPLLGQACDNGAQGACRRTGLVVCAPDAMGVLCTAAAPGPGEVERCNGLDDDCDGVADELPLPLVGTPCQSTTAACPVGQWQCTAGSLTCVTAAGSTELCNGLDDDCDALVDESPLEGEAAPCTAPGFETSGDTGECTLGATACAGGAMSCVGFVGPKPEICDGKDNDCDGAVDDAAQCPAGSTCAAGACVLPCSTGRFPCPAGYRCEDLGSGAYCVGDPCSSVTCGATERCEPATGVCTDLCAGLQCPADQSCSLGVDGGPQCGGASGPAVPPSCGCAAGEGGGALWLVVLGLVHGLRRRRAVRSIGALRLGGLVVALATFSACEVNNRTDGGASDAGGLAKLEVCNGVDDDLDGVIDQGFDLAADPNHCGACDRRCGSAHAFGACTDGTCTRGDCKPGFADLDANPEDCEAFCIQTNGGVEACDGVDNDCDGLVDDGFDTRSDVNHCGGCGRTCAAPNATPGCDAGTCQVAGCNAGFVDLNGAAADGCEAQCTSSNGGLERCDGVDNDCDGFIDDGDPDGGVACGANVGVCTAGTTLCSGGALTCVGASGGSVELCNDLDDDCDGVVDDGFDKQNDVQHCGGCSACTLAHASPSCAGGSCVITACAPGFTDLDGQASTGCEYACVATGLEVCDRLDNDCDGQVDEGFDLVNDRNHCGACGRVCAFTSAAASCVSGACVLGACNTNFHDIDGVAANGCEYGCIASNGGVEVCDARDNDCDGTIDDGNPGGGVACGTNQGECAAGTTACTAGALSCQGAVVAVAERCNNLDDDCNGVIDNGFDKLTDPRFCGDCTPCVTPSAVPGCVAGACTVASCLAGRVNLNGLVADGCEYACTFTGGEVCDGLDNDCDGLVDAADPSLLVPANFCRSAGECAGTTPTCAGSAGWSCVYTDPDVELNGGNLALEETRCDGRDNDCDGAADEVFPLKNTACAEDGTFGTTRRLGACRGTGTLICNAAQSGLRCNITAAGATPVSESCDDRDNDCDGHVDEPYDSSGFTGVRDVVVGPLTINGQSVVMYRYEASRPDAVSVSPGVVETRACSVASRQPWATPTFSMAQAACAGAGLRLCRVTRNGSGQVTTDEWGRFCEGAANRVYPYGTLFNGTACNGSDFDPVPGGVNEDQAIATGTAPGCVSADLANDLSGNLKEWTDDPRVVGGQTVYTLRGGSFDNHASGLTCDFDLTVVPPGYSFANTGFRCCGQACGAGQSDCSGTCRNLATDANHCGACGRVCAGGQACSNGYCCPAGTVVCPGTDLCRPPGGC